jgi:hypothetical protein
MQRRLLLVLCLLLTLSLLPGTSRDPLAPEIAWWAITSGGGRVSGGALVIDGVAGQAVVASTTAGTSELCAAFLCVGGIGSRQVYLPLITR